MAFHLISFEGPDLYSRAGGIATRVVGLADELSRRGYETHLWFIGDPDAPGHEQAAERLYLHRWCQWISRSHPNSVYAGEEAKEPDFARSLPPYLLDRHLRAEVASGIQPVVLAEEWQSVHVVFHLDWLLRREGIRSRVRLLWNANNTFGFDRIDFGRLGTAAIITTVSQYMRRLMLPHGCDPIVIPNGLPSEAYPPVPKRSRRQFEECVRGRLPLSKVARWDLDKRWISAFESIAELRDRGHRPVLIARGGAEARGLQILRRARRLRLRIAERELQRDDEASLIGCFGEAERCDVVLLRSHLGPVARRLLFHASAAVLANSRHEPFGLVGLETMAVGGVACTGATGEEYARAGANALVLARGDAAECVQAIEQLQGDPSGQRALRAGALRTARRYSWERVVEASLLPLVTRAGGCTS